MSRGNRVWFSVRSIAEGSLVVNTSSFFIVKFSSGAGGGVGLHLAKACACFVSVGHVLASPMLP